MIFLDGRRRKALDETDEPLDRLVVANDRQTDTEIERSDAATLVRTLISRLPARQRQVITMRATLKGSRARRYGALRDCRK